MFDQQTIDQINNLDIIDVIERFGAELKKKGKDYKACCPFPGHEEKTPSFSVSTTKNICKCFGCGKGGNTISFVMEYKSVQFVDAVHMIAKEFNIKLPQKEYTDEEKKDFKKKESIHIVNDIVCKWFEQNLYKPDNALALEYVLSRWNKKTAEQFRIGFAPDDWQGLVNYAKNQGIKKEILIEAGLIKENKKGGEFDFFRKRIIIPIFNSWGKVIGFTGRYLGDFKKEKQPKYFNTEENKVYNKSEVLYGYNFAQREIRNKNFAYIVEGNADVIKLHELEIYNTVGICGTSLTKEHINQLSNKCNSCVIIPDTDNAGLKSLHRSAKMLIENGKMVNVLLLQDSDSKKKEKHDADSFFKNNKQFKDYANSNISDYILWQANELKEKTKNPDFKLKVIDDLSHLVVNFNDSSTRNLYIEQLGDIIKPKKAWADKIKELDKENVIEEEVKLPKHVDIKEYEKYGFYEENNFYKFNVKGHATRGSNFVMHPLFHIKSITNSKRLYEIVNEFGHREVIELTQKDLIGLSSFKLRVESLGNFIWESGEIELIKLKRFLYERTESCLEITQLGWQKNGFFAWSSGIYNGKYTPIDKLGIVEHEGIKFYLPALSEIYDNEDTLFISERNFIHRDKNNISFNDYSEMLIKVFGENAKIGICFLQATLFRDFIVNKFNFFPILNLFGPKGSGKTGLAVSLLQFFGKHKAGPNINNTSKPALADHISQVSNALVHIDEYKNSIEFEKIEFLKGIWDGTGRTRMNMDKDKKKETTAVDCGLMLTGQEMPTADIALFSRLIYLTFHKTEYKAEERLQYDKLKDIEKKGLTHLTHEILKYRKEFIDNFFLNYDTVVTHIKELMERTPLEDRILKNWAIIICSFKTMEKYLELPFNYNELLKLSAQLIKAQQQETSTNNEVSVFWNIVQYLYADGFISEEVDYKLKVCSQVKTDKVNIQFNEPKTILYLQHSRIFTLYRKQGKQAGEKILPIETLNYYLKNDPRYLGKSASVRFKTIDPATGKVWEDETSNGSTKSKYKITTAYTFLYDELDISITNSTEEEDMFGVKTVTNASNAQLQTDQLNF